MEHDVENITQRDWHTLKPGDVFWFANAGSKSSMPTIFPCLRKSSHRFRSSLEAKTGRFVMEKSSDDSLARSRGSGIARDLEVDNLATIVSASDEAIQNAKLGSG